MSRTPACNVSVGVGRRTSPSPSPPDQPAGQRQRLRASRVTLDRRDAAGTSLRGPSQEVQFRVRVLSGGLIRDQRRRRGIGLLI